MSPGGRSQAVSWSGDGGGGDGDSLWVFGGWGVDSGQRRDVLLNDLWVWSKGSSSWTLQGGSTEGNSRGSTSYPGARRGASVWKLKNGDVYMWGGTGFETTQHWMTDLNDMWVFRRGGGGVVVVSSVEQQPVRPQARRGAHAWSCVVNNALYLWGGFSATSKADIDDNGGVWMFDPSTRVWTLVTPTTAAKPAPRSQGAVWVVGQTLWLYGGWGARTLYSDIWSFDTVTRQWTLHQPTVSGPARYGAAAWAEDGESQHLLHLWGGYGDDNPPYAAYMSDHWVIDVSLSPPVMKRAETPSDQGANWNSVACAAGGRVNAAVWWSHKSVYLFGGDGLAESSVGSLNDLVVLRGEPCNHQQYAKLMYGEEVGTSSSSSSVSSGDNTPAIVAGVVVGLLFAAALGAAAIFLWLRMRSKRHDHDQAVSLRSLARIKAAAALEPGSPSTPTPLNPSAAEKNELRRQQTTGDFE